ncbi:GNAT family N-acetyltransferase [Rhodoplanes serenus]|uniref:GNAT family N-acetyltransferase n=1 Tax=Rhodoplanes serenus TaxID=200615 RepID=UPI0032C3D6AA
MIASPTPAWRPMTATDLDAVLATAAVVHPDLPESAAVFAERLRLWPAGCFVLDAGGDMTSVPAVIGYVVSHPWRSGAAPALDCLLGRLPDDAATHYLHDLALLPAARGSGAGGRIVTTLAAHARATGFSTLSLVSVGDSAGFWTRQGFAPVDDPALADKLASYGAARYMVRRL